MFLAFRKARFQLRMTRAFGFQLHLVFVPELRFAPRSFDGTATLSLLGVTREKLIQRFPFLGVADLMHAADLTRAKLQAYLLDGEWPGLASLPQNEISGFGRRHGYFALGFDRIGIEPFSSMVSSSRNGIIGGSIFEPGRGEAS